MCDLSEQLPGSVASSYCRGETCCVIVLAPSFDSFKLISLPLRLLKMFCLKKEMKKNKRFCWLQTEG